jgi:hypothetical protein
MFQAQSKYERADQKRYMGRREGKSRFLWEMIPGSRSFGLRVQSRDSQPTENVQRRWYPAVFRDYQIIEG